MQQDLINQVNNYLNGELPYEQGVLLFSQLSRNNYLKRFFSLKHTHAKELKLKNELHKITKQYEEASTKQQPEQGNHSSGSTEDQPSDATQTTPETNKDLLVSDRYRSIPDRDVLPGLIERIKHERKELYRLRGFTHASLHNASTDQERYTLCLKIMDTQDQINELNRDLKLVQIGKVPGKYMKKDRTADEYIRIRNLKMYISRFEKKLKNCNSLAEKNEIQAILDKHKQELESLI